LYDSGFWNNCLRNQVGPVSITNCVIFQSSMPCGRCGTERGQRDGEKVVDVRTLQKYLVVVSLRPRPGRVADDNIMALEDAAQTDGNKGLWRGRFLVSHPRDLCRCAAFRRSSSRPTCAPRERQSPWSLQRPLTQCGCDPRIHPCTLGWSLYQKEEHGTIEKYIRIRFEVSRV